MTLGINETNWALAASKLIHYAAYQGEGGRGRLGNNCGHDLLLKINIIHGNVNNGRVEGYDLEYDMLPHPPPPSILVILEKRYTHKTLVKKKRFSFKIS